MDSQTASQTSPASPQPSRLWGNVCRGVGILLLGYVAVAYLIVPRIWETYARRHPSFDDHPRLTKTGDGHPGDALNVALTGTENELKAIMSAAKWYPADPLGLRSDLRIGVDTVLKRSYDEAPVSSLYLYDRPEDLAFEQPVGDDPRQRHTAADIDTERAHVLDTLQQTGGLAETYKVPGFHKQLEGKNGGGDRWYTDGALWVGVIKENFKGGGDL